jgi:hypothetical protein
VLVALAERFGWSPSELLALTGHDIVRWSAAAADFDRDQASRRPPG